MIRVLFFASLREELGEEAVSLEASGIRTVLDLVDRLGASHGESFRNGLLRDNVLVAVNQALTDIQARVADNDEVAFFPPVTGG